MYLQLKAGQYDEEVEQGRGGRTGGRGGGLSLGKGGAATTKEQASNNQYAALMEDKDRADPLDSSDDEQSRNQNSTPPIQRTRSAVIIRMEACLLPIPKKKTKM